MVGFNLFFSPLVPLTDALANTGKSKLPGLWSGAAVGSIAFVIGSALTGKLVSLYDYRAILALLTLGVASMLLGMLLRPSVPPQGKAVSRRAQAGPPGVRWWHKVGVFSPASVCCKGRTPPTTVLAPSTGRGWLFSIGGRLFMVVGRGGGSDHFALSKSYSAGLAPATCCCFLLCAAWYAGD